jgi:hypothetical protein
MDNDHSANNTAHAFITAQPLEALFYPMIERVFFDRLGLLQREIGVYLASILAEFAHSDAFNRIHNAQGKPLREVAEMLSEADINANADSFDREREVHKYIGDLTLFWAGVYPEALESSRRQMHLDHLIDYVRQGKQSYYIVSTFQQGRYSEDAPLFRHLSEEFELCLYGLRLVRREWEHLTGSANRF